MRTPARQKSVRYGLARVLSKRGVCSRSEAERWIRSGRVAIDGRTVRDAEHATSLAHPGITIDGAPVADPAPRFLVLNKPRGLVTTVIDDQGRDTVYRCFDGAALGWIAPVGRLDKASEGLLLFTNDPTWAACITGPETGPTKTYHVQVDGLPDAALLRALETGITDDGEVLRAQSATSLRSGGKTAWLEITLDEGRNRQIRRLLAAFDLATLRLVRVAIGPLLLGTLAKAQWRPLEDSEARSLAPQWRPPLS